MQRWIFVVGGLLALAAGCKPKCEGVTASGTYAGPDGVDAVVGTLPVLIADGLSVLGGIRDAAPVDGGEWTLCLPLEPEIADIVAPDPVASPDFRLATYLVGVWDDADGDLDLGEGEDPIGASPTMFAWSLGEPPPDAPLGVDEGWHTLGFDITAGGGEPEITVAPFPEEGLTGFEVPPNLVPVTHERLDATLLPAHDAAVTVDLLWMQIEEGATPAEPILATAAVDASTAGATFSFEGAFSTAPPADHLLPMGDGPVDLEMALYHAVAYEDVDASGTWDQGEPLVAASSLGEAGRIVVYVEADELLDAFWLAAFGLPAGWSLIDADAAGEGALPVVDWSAGMDLTAPSAPGPD